MSGIKSCLIVALLLLAPIAWSADDGSGFGVRLGGGYGFSLNSKTTSLYSPKSTGESSGIPAAAELTYAFNPNLALSLGIFPVFMSNSFSLELSPGSKINETDSATYLPVLISVYFEQPIGGMFKLMAGVGAGVVPATTVQQNFDQGWTSYPVPLDAGFALRASLGLAMDVNRHLRFGLAAQELTFSQTVLLPYNGWMGLTRDFNQIAPMLFVDLRI